MAAIVVRVQGGEVSTKTQSTTPMVSVTIPSSAWPSLALYDDAAVIRAKFIDLITTRAIYSLSVNHLHHFDSAWKVRSISKLREVYWEVLKRWCFEESARYHYTHRPATVVRYDRWKKVAVVEEVNPDLQS